MEVPKHPSLMEYSQPEAPLESYPEVVVPQLAGPSKEDGVDLRRDSGPFSREWWGARKRLWFIALTIIIIIIIAAVVGGCVGGIHRPQPPSLVVPLSSGPSTIPSAIPATPTSTATPTPTMSGTATVLSSYYYPTAISWGFPHLEVLVPSKNRTESIYWKYRGLTSSDTIWNPTDGSLELVGGAMATFDTSVAAITRGQGQVDIFQTGSYFDNAFHKSHGDNASWTGASDIWDDRGGGCVTAPAVVSYDNNHIDMFVLGDNNDLFQQSWDITSGWGSWIRIGGNWTAFVPTPVSWGDGRLDVFVVDPDTRELYHTFWDGSSWQPPPFGFESLSGYCTSRPIAISRSSNKIDVFVRGGDSGLWHLSYSNTWSNWTSISGNTTIQAEPEAIAWSANRIDVFAWGSDQSLLHKSFDETTGQWTPSYGFETLGGGLGGPPKGVSDAVGSLHVFSFSRYGSLQHISFNQTVGTWSPQGAFEDLGTPPGGI